ncbi:MAG: Fic family protein [Coriobacteriia bacterium]
MYLFNMTDAIISDVRHMEQLAAQLDARGPMPRIWTGRTRQDLEVEATAASTRIEGVSVTVDEARRILAGDRPAGVAPIDAALVGGYRDAMRYVLARADAPDFEWQSELLLSIHHRVLGGSHVQGAGRLRDNQNWLTNRGTGAQVYLPPPPGQVPKLLDDLLGWLSSATESAPVISALVHIALAGIHPFRDGNGRTARIVSSLAMYRGGYSSPYFTSLEEWWGRHIDDYYRAFECLGSGWNPDADVTTFVEAHVHAQALQVDALSLRNAIEHAVWTVIEDIVVYDLRLHERATHALYDAFFARHVTNRYYRGMAGVSDVTASHDLGKLVASELLMGKGAGRSAHYLGTAALAERIAAAAGLGADLIDPGAPLAQPRDAVLGALGELIKGTGCAEVVRLPPPG